MPLMWKIWSLINIGILVVTFMLMNSMSSDVESSHVNKHIKINRFGIFFFFMIGGGAIKTT